MKDIQDVKKLIDLYLEEKKYIGSAVHIRFYPMVIKRMEGKYIWDVNDKKYLDFNASWAVANIGHSHPKVIEALREQLNKFISASFTTYPFPEAIEYSKKILSLSRVGRDKKIIFGHSGSDINDGVYKLSLLYTKKERFISYIGAYHGQTLGSYSVSGHKVQSLLPPYKDVIKIPYPYCYRCPFGLKYPDCKLRCLKYLDHILSTAIPPETVAGIFIEPVQSDGGDVVPPREYHRKLRELADKYNLILIMDEVKVGLGRTGNIFASDTFDVVPDIITMGKPVASGLPLSLALVKSEIADSMEGSHLFTLSPNPLSIAAANATLDVIVEEKLHQNAEKVGEYLKKRLIELMDKHEFIGDVRGKGLIVGIELVKDKEDKTPASKETAKVVYRAWELGLITAYTGMYSNVIELTPPLIINEKDVDEAVEIIDKSIEDVEKDRIPDDKIRLFSGW